MIATIGRICKSALIVLLAAQLARAWLNIPAEYVQHFYVAVIAAFLLVYGVAYDTGWNSHIDDQAQKAIDRIKEQQQQGRR